MTKKKYSNKKNSNKINKKGGASIQLFNKTYVSKEPYFLEIKKFTENEKLLDNPEMFKSNLEFSPLSGSERPYNPDLWNNDPSIRETHNCYSYALGKIVKGLDSKAQPGYASGYNHIDDNEYDCKSFRERLKKDVPGSYLETFDNSCIPGFYKVFMALDVKNDYHWWLNNNDGYWSHKPGSTEVTNVDADGQKIKNPLKANRNYGSLNYYKPCFFACIQSELARAIDNIYNIQK